MLPSINLNEINLNHHFMATNDLGIQNQMIIVLVAAKQSVIELIVARKFIFSAA